MYSAFKASCVTLAFAIGMAATPVLAQYRLCAFRDGPQGPCTCEAASSKPGEYVPAEKKWCRKSQPKPDASTAAAKPALASDAAAASTQAAATLLAPHRRNNPCTRLRQALCPRRSHHRHASPRSAAGGN